MSEIFHSHPSDGDDQEQETTTPQWEEIGRWASYLSLGHVVLMSDETGTVVTIFEKEASIGNLAILKHVVSFDLVGGAE